MAEKRKLQGMFNRSQWLLTLLWARYTTFRLGISIATLQGDVLIITTYQSCVDIQHDALTTS